MNGRLLMQQAEDRKEMQLHLNCSYNLCWLTANLVVRDLHNTIESKYQRKQTPWDGENFSQSTKDVRLAIDSQVPILHATLRNCKGEFTNTQINLAERINNNDGQFHVFKAKPLRK
ncbi:uncharacterized protein BROUX77_003705 [Berkeleyomyces rouxiae]|uniref:uncharacterized protein n=1 Tax=Berkeleyomyces rouxiae TaxID=2035830 RepID=UPI003B7C7924